MRGIEHGPGEVEEAGVVQAVQDLLVEPAPDAGPGPDQEPAVGRRLRYPEARRQRPPGAPTDQDIDDRCEQRLIRRVLRPAALDPEAVSGVATIMNNLAVQGITTLCVTHEMRFARHIADRIVFMDQGRIMEITPPEQFFTNPQTTRARNFLNQMIG